MLLWSIVRETAVIAIKELRELWRQPKTLVLVVLGPFLVLAAFGAGYRNEEVALRTVFVGPESGPYESAIERYSGAIDEYVVPIAFTSNFFLAVEDLKADRTDIVIVLPPAADEAVLEGRQSEIAVIHNSIDPIEQIGIDFATEVAVRELNATVVTATLDELLETARNVDETTSAVLEGNLTAQQRTDVEEMRSLVDLVLELEASTLARPFNGDAESLVRDFVRAEQFVAPGATALLLQHLGVSIAALSLVRDERRGLLDQYRLGPTSVISVILGKLFALAGLSMAVGALMIVLQVQALGVPFRGSVESGALIVAGIGIASVSVGLALATVSRNELYATQAAMIVLLLALFFSGFLLNLDRIRAPFDAIALAVPAGPAVEGLRMVQLRGTGFGSAIWVSGAQSVVALAAASALLARRWRVS